MVSPIDAPSKILKICENPKIADEMTIDNRIPYFSWANFFINNNKIIPRKIISSKKPILRHSIKNKNTRYAGSVNTALPSRNAMIGKLLMEIINAGMMINKDFPIVLH